MSEVLKRSMFAMPLSRSARNSGIMEGFEEDAEDNMPDEIPTLARTPQNPEILMNNLRGDMRSVDARYDELAQMVGDEAAYETPPEVLAMLQPQFAAEQGSGIAGLAAAQGMQAPPMAPPGGAPESMAPPEGPAAPQMQPPPQMPPQMPPPMAPPTAPPGGGFPGFPPGGGAAPMQPPQGLAHGGIVQHFNDGSDEEGVTPSMSYPPELVRRAQEWATRQASFTPTPVPTLQSAMQARLPTYQELLGTRQTQEDMRTQMLLDLASRGLAFAGNVDDQGRPLRGSFASRLGQVTRTLPGTAAAMLNEQRKGELTAKQLALQAAEKDVLSAREANLKGIDEQRKLFTEILKSASKDQGQSVFGKGDWHWAVVNRPGFLANWAAGKTTPAQDSLIESALTVLQTPKSEMRADPVTGQPVTITTPPLVPQFVRDAQAARQSLLPAGKAPAATGTPGVRVRMTGTPQEQEAALWTALSGAPNTEERAALIDAMNKLPGAPAGRAPGAAPGAPAAAPAAPGKTMQPMVAAAPVPAAPPLVPYSRENPTLFNLAGRGTGPINVTTTFLGRVPLIGEFLNAGEEIQANAYMESAVAALNRSFATNPRFAEGERIAIQKQLELVPRLIDRPEAYQNRLIGLDDLLQDIYKKAYRSAYENPGLGAADIRAARRKLEEIQEARELMGLPPRINSMKEFEALEVNMPYILNGKIGIKAR